MSTEEAQAPVPPKSAEKWRSVKTSILTLQRRRLGLKNADVAAAIGVSVSQWRSVVAGLRMLTREQAEAAAATLRLRLSQIPHREVRVHHPVEENNAPPV